MSRLLAAPGLFLLAACGATTPQTANDDPGVAVESASPDDTFPVHDPLWPSVAHNVLQDLPWAPGFAFRPCESRRYEGDSEEPYVSHTLSYDSDGRLTARTVNPMGGPRPRPDFGGFCLTSRFEVWLASITYDEAGRVRCIEPGWVEPGMGGGTIQDCFQHDERGRVTSWETLFAGGFVARTQYAEDGTLSRIEGTLAAGAAVDNTELAYEGGRLVRMRRVFDGWGGIEIRQVSYNYNDHGQLVSVTSETSTEGDNSPVSGIAPGFTGEWWHRPDATRSFEYRADGRLERCVRGDVTVDFLHEDGRLVERRARSATGTVLRRVVYRYECGDGHASLSSLWGRTRT